MDKAHIASLALKSEFISIGDSHSVTACTKFINSLNAIDILACFIIDWDLPPFLESLVSQYVEIFKNQLLYYAQIGSVYYKNPDRCEGIKRDALTRILIYNLFCYSMLVKVGTNIDVWVDSADTIITWLDGNVGLLAQCGSYLLQDSCELLSTTPASFIQYVLL
jgi:hypothetical protein